MRSQRAQNRGLPELPADQAGQSMLEYALLVAVFGLPMLFVFVKLLEFTAGHYGMVTFLQTLPFP